MMVGMDETPTPDDDHVDPQPTDPASEPTRSLSTGTIVGAGLAALVVATVLGFAFNRDEETKVLSEVPTFAPTTTAAPTTSTSTTLPGVSAAPTMPSTPESPLDRSTMVWPDAGSVVRFTTAADAARSFATDLVGFTNPIVGEYVPSQRGSGGTVQVQATLAGAATQVEVREDALDHTWWVGGASTANIVVSDPPVMGVVSSPAVARGNALAFEGNVQVEVRGDGVDGAIGTGTVTGGGAAMGPFEGQISFDPGMAKAGSFVFRTRSAENGAVMEATVIRVRFSA